MTEHRFTCPLCGNELPAPYVERALENHELRHGTTGRSWCRNCEDFVLAVEHVIVFDTSGEVGHVYY